MPVSFGSAHLPSLKAKRVSGWVPVSALELHADNPFKRKQSPADVMMNEPKFKKVSGKIIVPHEGLFQEYDRVREIRMFAEARAKVSLDRPLKYENIEPHKLAEIKDSVFERIKDIRSSYFQVVEVDPNVAILKAKFTRCLRNIQLLRVFKRWKFINQQRLAERLKHYQEEVKQIFHRKAIESAEHCERAKQNLLLAKKYHHDHMRRQSIDIFNCIDRVKQELQETRKECFLALKQRMREKRA
jgi:hypothetical protein